MQARLQPRQLLALALLVAACALAAGGIYWFRSRKPAAPSDLVAYLPTANASVVYIDVDALRRSGILGMLAGSKTSEEPDYQQFVRQTKFDYRQDLDAVAAAFENGRTYFALRGRFHWSNLKDYATRQGGSCHNDFCVLTGSQPSRRISFYALKSNVLAMAIAPDDFAAYQVAVQPAKPPLAPPNEPVWALIPSAALQSMDTLPAAAKAFVPALQGADQIIFSIGSDRSQQLQLGVHVTCKDTTSASALLIEFETTTKALREALAHQHAKPDPADLSGVLVAGTFHRDERQVYGAWPIPRAFVGAIAGSAY
ncbi:MAG: hypothetical protein WBE37_19960 [Bryobacteraceae bacterium]